jgi:hypothetical protein
MKMHCHFVATLLKSGMANESQVALSERVYGFEYS